jgi:alkylated DNA repair dioxygenase AlkB
MARSRSPLAVPVASPPTMAGGPFRRIAAPDADLLHWPTLLDGPSADRLLAALLTEVAWERHVVRIAGRDLPCPRLSAWYGDPGATYTYSGLSLRPAPWIEPVAEIRRAVEAATGRIFDSVLANLYRDGGDSMGWHSDDEAELGPDPPIASVSLGATRRFVLRHRRRRDAPRLDLPLAHGSLLLMQGPTQHYWRHALPKTRRPVGARVNLTFRRIVEQP